MTHDPAIDDGPDTQPAEAAWRAWMEQARAWSDRDDPSRAAAAYDEALRVAVGRAAQWQRPGDALAAVVVCSLNLGDALAQSGRLQRAADVLCAMHASLLRLRDCASADAGMRLAAARHLRETYAAIVQFQSERDPAGLAFGAQVEGALHGDAASVPAAGADAFLVSTARGQTLH